MTRLGLVPFALLALGAAPGGAACQRPARPGSTPVPHHQVVSANPFLLYYEWFDAEIERRVGRGGALGVAATQVTLDEDDRYRSVALLYRRYIQGEALEGFHLGPRLGVYRVDAGQEEGTFFGVGVELGYQWLVGVQKNFSVSMGVGASHLFGTDFDDASSKVPAFRLLNVGWAF